MHDGFECLPSELSNSLKHIPTKLVAPFSCQLQHYKYILMLDDQKAEMENTQHKSIPSQ